GEWHHLVGTYDGDIIKLYIDGKFVDDATRNNIPLNVNGAVSIGGGNSSMDGVVDQVRIYDYARTPAQVAWEYNKGMPVAHYKFDECQGSTIHDSSGNNLHAVMNLGSS